MGALVYEAYQTRRLARKMVRNFYGELRIEDVGEPPEETARRKLMNGTINHGERLLSAHRRMQPTTYYGPPAGVGIALLNLRGEAPRRVGVIGLGAGVLASYGRKGDTYRFYEINPLVMKLAKSEFTFLSGSPAKVEVVMGDARLALEREPSGQFDVLVVDAFSSDAIPVHLLTKEAFALMFRHLRGDGILAVHISNRYLDLEPVIERTAYELGKTALLFSSEDDSDKALFGATWVLLSSRPETLNQPVFQEVGARLDRKPRLRTWTDDYSNLFQILK
jgi:SAM-dependent methyltransferase